MIADFLAGTFLITGAVLSLIAAIGIFRMPDLFTRMQAAAKTGTLGVGCTILGLAFHFQDTGVTTRAMMIIIFLFLTAPIAAHVIAKAGYIGGIELWKGTVVDELKGAQGMRPVDPDQKDQSPPAVPPDQK